MHEDAKFDPHKLNLEEVRLGLVKLQRALGTLDTSKSAFHHAAQACSNLQKTLMSNLDEDKLDIEQMIAETIASLLTISDRTGLCVANRIIEGVEKKLKEQSNGNERPAEPRKDV